MQHELARISTRKGGLTWASNADSLLVCYKRNCLLASDISVGLAGGIVESDTRSAAKVNRQGRHTVVACQPCYSALTR